MTNPSLAPDPGASHHDERGDDDMEAHYSALERAECPWCFGGYVTITVEEDGSERYEAVPCRRCSR